MFETSACAPGSDFFSKGDLIDTMVQLTTCKQWLNFVDFFFKTNSTNALDFNADAKTDFDLTQYQDLGCVFFWWEKNSVKWFIIQC